MTVGTGYNGTSHYTESTTGTDWTATAFTVGGLFYYDTDSDRFGLIFEAENGGTSIFELYIDNGGGTDFVVFKRTAGGTAGFQMLVQGNYYLMFFSKPAGTSQVTLHYTTDGTNWTHTTGDGGTVGDITWTQSRISMAAERISNVTAKTTKCEFGVWGLWAETTDNATSVTYTDYSVLAAKTNAKFFTGTSMINGGSMVDSSGTSPANSQTGASNSAGAQSIPAWFTNFPPTNNAAISLNNFTVAATGSVFNPTATRIKEVGFVTNTTGGTTSAITVAAGGVPVGDLILIRGSCDNTGTNGVATTISVADNSSQSGSANTYTLKTAQAIADPGAASAGIQGFMVQCIVTRPLLAGDVITITYGNSTAAKAINAQQYSGVNKTTPTFGYTTQDNQTGQAVSLSASPTRVGQIVATLVAVEGGTADSFTEDADSTDGTWSTLTRRGSGTTTSGATLNSAEKKVTGTTAQSYGTATMLGTSRDHCAAILVIDNAIIEGTAAIALDGFTAAASGSSSSDTTGTAAIALNNFTVAASGTETISGSAAIALNNFTVAASGGSGITGSAAIALNDFTVAASGTETISGSAAIALNGFTVAASGFKWPFEESFTYANGTLEGAAPEYWDAMTGTIDGAPLSGSNIISSNAVVPGAAIYYDVSLFEIPFDDQYAFVDITPGSATDHGAAVYIRANSDGSDGYGVAEFWSAGGIGGYQYALFRQDNTVNTVLGTIDVAHTSGTHRIGVIAVGDQISMSIDGTIVETVTDSTYDGTNRHAFIGSYNFGTAGLVTMDDLEIGKAENGVSGSAAITLDSFTVGASGTEIITGSSAIALNNFTVAASGTVLNPVSGTAAITLDNFTVAGSGAETIVGTVAIALNNFVVAASGSEGISGSAAIALNDFVVAASGSEAISGSVAIALNNFVVAASGTETITGSAAIALNNFTVAGSGAESIPGSSAIALDNFVVAASGTVIPSVSGSAAITLNDFTVVGNSVLTVSGSAAIALDAFVVVAAGTEKITGSSAITLNNFVVASSGTELINGSAAIALNNFVVSASGLAVLLISGTSTIVLNNFGVNGSGTAGALTGFLKVWNGSAWVQLPVKVWNGSAWITKPVKVWNGSSWVTVT